MTGQGEIDVQTAGGSQRLRTGESASIVQGQIVKAQRAVDPLLEANWIHALLIRKGQGDEELAGRVDQLLARLGQSKVSFLYEQEIRSLGEHAALPLLRFVQSPLSQGQPQQRSKAIRILSDIVPTSMVPELVQLLSDEDAETRVLSARALLRLTGLDHGRPPNEWRAELRQCAATIDQWHKWLVENRQHYLLPASRVL
jgi:HEAT repeat protein